MSVLEALLLGVVQGLTEFLPISSSGHLIIVPWLQDYTFLTNNESFNKTFDVALHVGTLIAVISYFRHDLANMIRAFFRTMRTRTIGGGDERLVWVVLVGTIPAIIVGGLGSDWIDNNLGQPWMIAVFLIAGGLLLWLADRQPEQREVRDVTIKEGLLIGVAQALALSPGVSRSGITITAGRFLGLTRDAAARVSFLLLVPATAAAAVVKGADAISNGLPSGVGAPIIVGILSSAITGYFAIAGLLALVRRHSYSPFVVYRLIVGTAILLLIASGVREATL